MKDEDANLYISLSIFVFVGSGMHNSFGPCVVLSTLLRFVTPEQKSKTVDICSLCCVQGTICSIYDENKLR